MTEQERALALADDLQYVADELRRLAPAARTPPHGDSHVGRRAFQEAASRLEDDVNEIREDFAR